MESQMRFRFRHVLKHVNQHDKKFLIKSSIAKHFIWIETNICLMMCDELLLNIVYYLYAWWTCSLSLPRSLQISIDRWKIHLTKCFIQSVANNKKAVISKEWHASFGFAVDNRNEIKSTIRDANKGWTLNININSNTCIENNSRIRLENRASSIRRENLHLERLINRLTESAIDCLLQWKH